MTKPIHILGALTGAALIAASGIAHAASKPAPVVNYRILRDTTLIQVHKNGSYTKTVTRIVQPLTTEGVQSSAQIAVAYPANFATAKVLYAYTETKSGKKLNVVPSAIFDQSAHSALTAPFLSDGKIQSLIFPAVHPGDVLHIKYQLTFAHPYLPGLYAAALVLSPSIPIKQATLTLTVPAGMHAFAKTRGPWIVKQSRQSVTITGSYDGAIFPPMGSAAITQYAPMAVVTTSDDWNDLAHAYSKAAHSALTLTQAIKTVAHTAAQGATGAVAVQNIYRWMQQNIQTISVNYQSAGFIPPAASETLAKKLGDSNASATLLCALLQAENIKAVPALISQSPRFVPYPGVDPFAFSHFIVYVPAYKLYLDPRYRHAAADTIPIMDSGRPVLLTGSIAKLTKTPGPDLKTVQYDITDTMKLARSGELSGNSHQIAQGWRAAEKRAVLGDKVGRRLINAAETSFYQQGNFGTISNFQINHRDDLNKPIAVTYDFKKFGVLDGGSKGAMLIPSDHLIAGALAPFIDQSKRAVPTVTKPQRIQYTLHLQLPISMSPEFMPESVNVNTPIGDYAVNYTIKNHVLTVKKSLALKSFVVNPADYHYLHTLAIKALQNSHKVLLLKKSKLSS
ncbi:MAG TPA: DUF3857 domain-containing protein [Acidiphilium sp.]|nr:MAG: hypothetical protein B7Z67_06115 [Acidiphilium sp. 21-60-14]OYV90840.1 MAG: hypothetical protein B7Z57_07095 [Acidiphilium sp. 37-60-79]OZB38764.1 MAG: hypothetical protein B7X48_11945 [Acidiphilium sp. 34-60-192]HQT86950.1 DUF3857 domain-containing protein [Acidiphilium sp.]HQU24092.1 DUF3857 domain-containing protein [Acidiphilium sp.]